MSGKNVGTYATEVNSLEVYTSRTWLPRKRWTDVRQRFYMCLLTR